MFLAQTGGFLGPLAKVMGYILNFIYTTLGNIGIGNLGLSIILFAMMVNYKESFILLMPFLMLYVLYYELMQESGRLTWQTITKGIKAHFVYFIILGCIFLIPVMVIVSYVGTNNYGSVG